MSPDGGGVIRRLLWRSPSCHAKGRSGPTFRVPSASTLGRCKGWRRARRGEHLLEPYPGDCAVLVAAMRRDFPRLLPGFGEALHGNQESAGTASS